ncbi:DUF2789 domain-containing protein [Pseudomonas sp. JS3066]|jgi:hypothetical protein|uniref:DUF2789 domain-containing protein n=1 Tax=unclassified Pseudomonas TaxID=196821 RepID=UPI000EAA81B8|nr:MULTISPECIES: DUF2789 domain-containing protein [unclassified Pseudomonas]AYF87001.1 DUF2789 domain-containing protein [Pseudomonas sp. DY-1]MDH4651920.1 DUF2789 domain-containing protein [Pseudomonas sp. BN606]MRK23996.1 DUF2789 domain-containing protein [Pseudomonas sp. JG-B]WVK95504.1 DUF2789 domain-containing protein [Pseudomonas sp. JS3066]
MDTSHHSLSALFDQLGLPSGKSEIDSFVAGHRLAVGQALPDAPFWSQSQSSFLRDALLDDSDWAEEADELAVLLSK